MNEAPLYQPHGTTAGSLTLTAGTGVRASTTGDARVRLTRQASRKGVAQHTGQCETLA